MRKTRQSFLNSLSDITIKLTVGPSYPWILDATGWWMIIISKEVGRGYGSGWHLPKEDVVCHLGESGRLGNGKEGIKSMFVLQKENCWVLVEFITWSELENRKLISWEKLRLFLPRGRTASSKFERFLPQLKGSQQLGFLLLSTGQTMDWNLGLLYPK